MPESFNQNFMDAMSGGSVSPIVQIDVLTSTGDRLYAYSSPNLVNAGLTSIPRPAYGPQILLSVTPRSSRWDPGDDKFQVGGLTFTVDDNGHYRDLIEAVQVIGARVFMRVGTDDLQIGEWETVWSGFLSGYRSNGQTITINARGVGYTFKDSLISGEWTALHPLEVLLELFQEAGVSAGTIDAASFAYDAASGGRAEYEHLTVSRHGRPGSSHENIANEVGANGEPETAKTVIDDLARLCFGFIAADRGGQIRFQQFERSLPVTRHLSSDDIIDVEHINSSAYMCNQVRFSYETVRRSGPRTPRPPPPTGNPPPPSTPWGPSIWARDPEGEFSSHASERVVYVANHAQSQIDFRPVNTPNPYVSEQQVSTKWIKALGLVGPTSPDPRDASGVVPFLPTGQPHQRPNFYPVGGGAEVAPLIVNPALGSSWSPFRMGFTGTRLPTAFRGTLTAPATPFVSDQNLYWTDSPNPILTAAEQALVDSRQATYIREQINRVQGAADKYAYFLIVDSQYDGEMEVINGTTATPNNRVSMVRARSSWWDTFAGTDFLWAHWWSFRDYRAHRYWQFAPTAPNTEWGEVTYVPTLQAFGGTGFEELDEYGWRWPGSIHYEIDQFDMYNTGRYSFAFPPGVVAPNPGMFFWDRVYDITIPHLYAERRLSWLCYGAANIKIRLNLRHCDLRPGDIVSCDDDVFIGFANSGGDPRPGNGLSSSDAFMVIGVEDDYLGAPPGIVVELIWIRSTSPLTVPINVQPAIQAVQNSHTMTNPVGTSRRGLRMFTERGFDYEIVDATGLDVTIGPGALSDESRVGPASPLQTITLPANSNVLLVGSPNSRSIGIFSYGSTAFSYEGMQPSFSDSVLYRFTTGATSITAQEDLRTKSPIPGASQGPDFTPEMTTTPLDMASVGQAALYENTAGGDYGVRPGQGTGTGAGGDFFVDLARSGAAGSTLNTYTRALQIAAETGIESLISHTSDTDGHIHRATGTAQTVGATSAVVLSIDTFTANQGGYIRVDLSGTDAGGGGGAYRVSSWVLKASFTTDGAEAVTVHTAGASQILHSELGGSPYWIVIVAASGTSLEVQVTGAAGSTANWMATADWQARAIP